MLFRPQSDPTAPPAQHALDIRFRRTDPTAPDEMALVGYDLETESVAPSGTVTVRLYWHAPQPLTHTLRGAVRLTARNGEADWGGSESLSLAGLSQERWTAAGYGVDTYTFAVAGDAPPYLGDLRVSVFTTEGEYLLTEAGEVQAAIGTVRVTGNRRLAADEALTPVMADFGGQIALAGTVVEDNEAGEVAGETCVVLRWRVQVQPQADYTVMLHLLNAAGEAVAYHDAPPLGGLYPTSAWQAGQVLDDRHCFARTPEAVDVRIALYTQVGDSTPRLPLRVDGQPAPDDALTLPLATLPG